MAELPKSLEDAIAQSCIAVKAALADGCTRIQVDLLFPELKPSLVAEQFLSAFTEYDARLKVFFADAGAAALARRDWVNVPFKILDVGTGKAAPTDAKIEPEDELFVFIAPSSVELVQVEQLAEKIGDRPFIMLNPRLEDSGVVGIGYAAREIRRRFISTIESCYYLRPVDDETAVYRCYPGLWEVWVETNGEYQKVVELPTRPSGDELDQILMTGSTTTATTTTPAKKPNFFKSLQRFFKALSS